MTADKDGPPKLKNFPAELGRSGIAVAEYPPPTFGRTTACGGLLHGLHTHRIACMTTTAFKLADDYVELNQLLKLVGVCDSGGMGKTIVASGAVTVDGVVEWRKTCKIRAGQVVQFADVVIRVM